MLPSDMYLCMRTTLDLNDDLLKRARRRAIERKTSLTSVVEESLRHFLIPKRRASRPFAERWPVVGIGKPPAIDIADRDRLYDALEGRRR